LLGYCVEGAYRYVGILQSLLHSVKPTSLSLDSQ
jgi:hypothetical protein